MARTIGLIVRLVAVIALGGCGSLQPRNPSLEGSGSDTAPGYFIDGGKIAEVRVLDASHEYGQPADYTVHEVQAGSSTVVSITATGEDIRTCYLEIYYDASAVHPTLVKDGAWPGLTPSDTISLAFTEYEGVVYYGAALVNLDERRGVSGSFDAVSVVFERGAFSQRQVMSAPSSAKSQVGDLTVEPVSGLVSFSYKNQGDYDQNGEVNVSDLSPLAANLGSTSPGGAGTPWPFDTALSQVDGDDNGELNVSDLTAIAANFQKSVAGAGAGFAIYAGASADYPGANPLAGNGAATPVGLVGMDKAQGAKQTNRLVFSETIAALAGTTAEAAWLRPTDGSAEGIASNVVSLGAVDTTPPVWTNDPGGVGAIAAIPRNGDVEVVWGEATDAQSAPVTYHVYYSPGPSVDFGTATVVDVPAPAEPGGASTVISGLSNGSEYSFAVRASDSAPTPNTDANEVVVSATPNPAGSLQSLLDADQAFETGMSCDGSSDVSNGPELDFSGDLFIPGTFNVGSGGARILVEGNLVVNGTINFILPDTDLTPPNEDLDTLLFIVKGDVTFGPSAVVNSEGNFEVINDPADEDSPTDTETDTVTDNNPGAYPFNFMPDDGSGALGHFTGKVVQGKSVSSHNVYYGPPRVWIVRGNWGKVPVPPKGTKRIILRIRQAWGELRFQDWTIDGPNGRDGAAETSCTAVGEDGQDNKWIMRMHASKKMTFNNVNITFGRGGHGGDAIALDCCPGSATGGKGGDASNKFRFTAGQEIQINGALNLNPGPGGDGGDATSSGQNGPDGCPGDPGCDATSIGGEGGNVPGWGVRVRGNVGGTSNINLGVATGGAGGSAISTGGNGGNGLPCCNGGPGGIATSTGGKGGNAKYTDTGSGVGGGGAEGGVGGGVEAYGGDGGDGGDCYKAPGGDGGAGGDANATAGQGGTATGSAPLTQGEQGPADALGGQGGACGDGCPPGVAGIGGLASADGNPGNAMPGADGPPCVEWPIGCQVVWCIQVPDICPPAPGQILDGFSGDAPLIDMATLQPVGTVPFVWMLPVAGCVTWGLNPDTNEPTIDFFNGSPQPLTLRFDFSNVALDPGPYGGMVGANLHVRQSEPLSPTTAKPTLSIVDTNDMTELFKQDVTDTPYTPLTGPSPQDFNFPSSFFDVFFDVTCAPTYRFRVTEIYIIDP